MKVKNYTDNDMGEFDISPYADLSNADLSNADLTDADLYRTNLSNADLSYADLTDANLSNANLTDANLSYADLSYADLTGADLSRTNLTDANLSYANLTGARGVASCQFDERSYTLICWQLGGELMFTAGCHIFTFDEAIAHWAGDNYSNKKRGWQYVVAVKALKEIMSKEKNNETS